MELDFQLKRSETRERADFEYFAFRRLYVFNMEILQRFDLSSLNGWIAD